MGGQVSAQPEVQWFYPAPVNYVRELQEELHVVPGYRGADVRPLTNDLVSFTVHIGWRVFIPWLKMNAPNIARFVCGEFARVRLGKFSRVEVVW